MADIKYVIDVDEKGATSGVKKFDQTLNDLETSSGKAEKAHTGLWKQVALGAIAWQAATKAARFLVDTIKDSIAAAMEQEKVDRALAASLEITGRPVEALVSHFKDYASALQKATIYGDEEIEKVQTLLVQLTNLDKDGLDRATKGTIGLASVLGMDLNAAAQLVSKAMSGNASMLSRYGIQIDATKSKEEQRIEVLDKLEKFYGRATADTETFSGRLAQLKNKYGDLLEVAGAYITSNTKILISLQRLADETLFYLTLKDRLAKQQQSQEQTEKNLWKNIWEATYAIGFESKAILDLSKKHDGNVFAVMRAISTDKQYLPLKEALNKVRRSELEQFEVLRKELREAERGTNKFTDATEGAAKEQAKQNKLIKEFEAAMKKADKVVEDWNKDIKKVDSGTAAFNDTLRATKTYFNGAQFAAFAADEMFRRFAANSSKSANKVSSDWAEAITSIQEKLDTWGQYANQAILAVDAVINRSYQNKALKLDADYQRQLENIKNSKMSEQEKQEAITALESEYNMKRREMARQEAQAKKFTEIATTTINIASAVVAALKAGPIIGPILAAMIGALGLKQLMLIKSTPIPLAKGAIFKQPTFLDSERTGQKYQVAEAGEAEIISNARQLREAILGKGRQGGRNISLTLPVYIAGKKVSTMVVKMIEDASEIGSMKISAKAIA